MSHLSVEILYESKEKNLFCSYQLLFLLYQYEKIKSYQLYDDCLCNNLYWQASEYEVCEYMSI